MNFSSRVESANKQFKSRILISDEVYQKIKNNIVIKDHMRTMVKGIDGRVTLHEVDQIHLSEEIEQLQRSNKIIDGIDWRKAYKVESFDLDPQQIFRINRLTILVIKVDNKFYALDEKCPHMNLTMKGGEIDSESGTINCAWHNTTFCYKSGEVKEWIKVGKTAKFLMKTLMKSNKQADGALDMEPSNIETYPTKIIDGFVWVGLR
jgi:nitrite reductase/ring-hydroxylating ferredoxin subunit